MLEHLFGSTTRLELLQVFFRAPERAFYVRELTRLVEKQLNAVRREIANLEGLGIIKQVPAGSSRVQGLGTERSKYYKLNKDFLLFSELNALLFKNRDLEEQHLVDEVKKRGGRVRFMLLTGVFTGTEDEVDTDLLLVGRIRPLAVGRIIKSFEKIMGRPLRYTLMDEKEFNERREIGDKFLYGIFEAKNITAVDELGVT